MKQDLLDLFQKYPSVDKKAMGFLRTGKMKKSGGHDIIIVSGRNG